MSPRRRPPPSWIQEARATGDISALRAGAEAANRRKADEKKRRLKEDQDDKVSEAVAVPESEEARTDTFAPSAETTGDAAWQWSVPPEERKHGADETVRQRNRGKWDPDD